MWLSSGVLFSGAELEAVLNGRRTRLKTNMGMLKYRSSRFVENLHFPFLEHYKKKELPV